MKSHTEAHNLPPSHVIPGIPVPAQSLTDRTHLDLLNDSPFDLVEPLVGPLEADPAVILRVSVAVFLVLVIMFIVHGSLPGLGQLLPARKLFLCTLVAVPPPQCVIADAFAISHI